MAAIALIASMWMTCSIVQADDFDPYRIYVYADDFDTDKAREDSYDHSVFWPENAFPPPEPYLFYSSMYGIPPSGPRGLAFADYYGEPAHLNYCFPVRNSHFFFTGVCHGMPASEGIHRIRRFIQ